MGPTARTVATNLRRLREARGMSLRALSTEVEKAGRTLSADALNKIENGRHQGEEVPQKQIRRADVDDLVAIALALNVSPLTLLLPDASGDQIVELTDKRKVRSLTAWQWGEGQRTAMDYTPGPIANFGPDGDPAINAEAFKREQEFEEKQSAFTALARPQARQRAASHPALRVLRELWEFIEDIVTPEPGVDRAALAARLRIAQRRYTQLGLDLEEIAENLPPVHPGLPASGTKPDH